MEKYNFILDRIHEAVPETMELKFGCRVNNWDGKGYIFLRNNHFMSVEPEKMDMNNPTPWGLNLDNPEVKILGTDPTLADVLKTIGKNYKDLSYFDERFFYWKNFVDNKTGKPCKWKEEGHNVVYKWNLSHDSLLWHRDNQPETIEWLYEILK